MIGFKKVGQFAMFLLCQKMGNSGKCPPRPGAFPVATYWSRRIIRESLCSNTAPFGKDELWKDLVGRGD